MARHREIDAFVRVVAGRVVSHALTKLQAGEDDGAMRYLWLRVVAEYRTGKLARRVRAYVKKYPLTLGDPAVVWSEMFKEIGTDAISEAVGNFGDIPPGIEPGDMWLTPGGSIQKMLLEKVGDDAIMVIEARRAEDGSLEPALFWTENEEIIAEAQKGHRKYMELLAKGAAA
jgi:hypothetical protein